MWSVVVCDDNITERERIIEYVKVFSDDKGQEIAVQGAADWPELFEKLKQAEPDVLSLLRMVWKGWTPSPMYICRPGDLSGFPI